MTIECFYVLIDDTTPVLSYETAGGEVYTSRNLTSNQIEQLYNLLCETGQDIDFGCDGMAIVELPASYLHVMTLEYSPEDTLAITR